MGLFSRSASKGPKERKLDTVEKAVSRIASDYDAFPGVEKVGGLRLFRTIWEFLDKSELPHVGAALGPFLLTIGPLMLTRSRSLGARLVLALDEFGGNLARDLAQAIGVPRWREKVASARRELGRGLPAQGPGLMGSDHDGDAA